jgi:hypothetical protein
MKHDETCYTYLFTTVPPSLLLYEEEKSNGTKTHIYWDQSVVSILSEKHLNSLQSEYFRQYTVLKVIVC